MYFYYREFIMPRRYSSDELIKMVEGDGWTLDRVKGSHHHFHHKTKKGIVTIPHPAKDIDAKTASSIKRQAGLK
jgi:predicted RNA binding protein YcfA (HicA-like mRNA interferase family)